MIDNIVNAAKEIGFKELIDKNGDAIQSHDGKKYIADAKGHIYEINPRHTEHPSGGYPGLSVATTSGKSKTYPCHQIMMWTFNGLPEQFFLDKKIYLQAGISEEEWNKCPQSIKDAYIKEYATGKVIDHVNANKDDYSADNLQYLSLEENSKKGNK